MKYDHETIERRVYEGQHQTGRPWSAPGIRASRTTAQKQPFPTSTTKVGVLK